MRPQLLCAAMLLATACAKPNQAGADASHAANQAPQASVASPTPDVGAGARANLEDAHRVVFADRTSQGYLLLIDEMHAGPLDRDDLQAIARKRIKADASEPEFDRLLELIATEPRPAFDDGTRREVRDLLGLHVEIVPIHGPGNDLISAAMLLDPVLTRTLDREQRTSLATRDRAILLRAHYRNQFAVRGLRLLQILVRAVAAERDALVHDPDTGETMTLPAFTERRLQASLGNVADQVAVVPFADPRHGGRSVRLTTRGMRRFGSVDLELDDLPPAPELLQAGTHLLYGLAGIMVAEGELDPSGYAVELPPTLEVGHNDIVRAYGERAGAIPRCADCQGWTRVHLVERGAEPHDPVGHVVARVVAPRPASDAPGYDQRAWVMGALRELLGP